MSLPPSRPWFRLAPIMRPGPPPPTRPPPPPTAQQQTFRPPVALPQATQATPPPPAPTAASIPPRTSAPPSPVPPTTPAPMSSPVASPPPRATAPTLPKPPSPPPPRATAPPSPAKTAAATSTSPATQSQPAPSTTRSPTTTPVQSPPPPISSKPTSPITKTSSSLPASPGQKTSPKMAPTHPDVSYSSLQPSPKTKPSAPPPSPLATSPAFRTVPSTPAPPQPSPVPTAAPIATVTARATTPVASPKIDKPWVETPPQSAKEKLLSHPPSPLTLPPAQLKAGGNLEPIPAEVEQKTVLLQETEDKSRTTPKTSNGGLQRSYGEDHNSSIAHHGKREKKDKGVHAHKKPSDSEEFGIRVITLAGENKGAIMELSPSRKMYGSGARSNGGQKLKNESDEGSSRMKDEKHKAVATGTAPMDAFINCNVQGVNNSILYNCSCTHKDPGVHLFVSRKSNGGDGVHHMKD